MHLSEILAEKGITLQKTFVEKSRDHVPDAGKMIGERAELIKELLLLKFHVGGSIGDIVKRAADMLEADGEAMSSTNLKLEKLIKIQYGPKAQQVAVPPGVYELIERWGKRSREALPADAMLINKCIRELILTAAPQGDKQ